jgi:hypothetical protein
MTPAQATEWRRLLALLSLACKYRLKLCLHKAEKIYITIDTVEEDPLGGCGQCHERYSSIRLEGTISDGTNRPKIVRARFDGHVSQWDMHECPKTRVDDPAAVGFCPLFKLDLVSDANLFWHFYPPYDQWIRWITSQVHLRRQTTPTRTTQ